MKFQPIPVLLILCASATAVPVFAQSQPEGSTPRTIGIKTTQADGVYDQEALKHKNSLEIHIGALHPGGDLKESYSNGD